LISINTPLGKDVLLLHTFSGTEGISRPYSFNLTLLSENVAIPFSSIVGQRVTLTVKKPDGIDRHINGFVSRFAQAGSDSTFSYYHAEVVPWLWFLTRNSDCRIFQNMTIPAIVKKVFRDRGFNDFTDRLQGHFSTREYCVQYRESDFNFVSRLMEQYGIFYYFEHEQNSHTLVLANSPAAHRPCPDQARARWEQTAGPGGLPEEEDVITELRIEQEFRAGKHALSDYNFETPSTKLHAHLQTKNGIGNNARHEIYDYPGEYVNLSEGNEMTALRMEEQEAGVTIATGSGTCRSFISGYRFTLENHYRQDLNKDYILTEVHHDASVGDSYRSGVEALARYFNHFTCIPVDTTFRPRRTTPRPFVQGPQTAVVTGPPGAEIHTDKHSRVKAQFHWDREGKHDENSSCWIRVSQPWAGKSWGGISIPRIGQEVVIDFLEGNPDRPIITGRVYNAERMPPYPLPNQGVVSGMKSDSTPGGGGYNEMSMNDTKGKEMVTVHAQRDMQTTVEHDKSETVDHNETITIVNDRTEQVGGNEALSVRKNRNRTVTQNEIVTVALTRTHSVGVNEMINVGAAQEVTVGGFRALTVGLYQNTTIGLNHTERIGVNHSETIGNNHSENIGSARSTKIGGSRQTEVGQADTLRIGQKLAIEAGDEITIKTGDASIMMKADGTVVIKGKDISITGSGKINVKADGNIIMKGQNILEN
jgi:type VI secretion system secreted protein VgrG